MKEWDLANDDKNILCQSNNVVRNFLKNLCDPKIIPEVPYDGKCAAKNVTGKYPKLNPIKV
jgi:hypothetical protein